jgi:hypothetical protein
MQCQIPKLGFGDQLENYGSEGLAQLGKLCFC